MPRPRSISWEERISIFLDYRRLGKVFPTAKAHSVARSTVASIVEEFIEYGFSKRHRPNASPLILTQAQEAHLQEVLQSFHTTPSIDLNTPRENRRAHLVPEDAISEGAESKLEQRVAISIKEELRWHIKETAAERTIQEAQKALRDYDQRCLALWNEIRSALEKQSDLKVRAYRSASPPMDSDPHIHHELVDLTYGGVFDDAPGYQLDPDNWRPNPDRPDMLMTGAGAVAVGEPSHEAIKQGMRIVLEQGFDKYHRIANELKRLHHDLLYVTAIVQKALQQTTEEDVRQGICPACPYPEARREPESGARQNKTSRRRRQ